MGNGRKSHIYRQDKHAFIPAATIRGCLRSFIETLTAGWVSQVTPEYKKDFKKRHIGFSTFDWYVNRHRNSTSKKEPAVDLSYKPSASVENEPQMLDVASYLFGIVIEKEDGSEVSHASLARKTRVWVEDAQIELSNLDKENYWLPDIAGDAFMGGAKPSASNWWYMQPKQVWQRDVKFRGEIKPTAEFIGERYWGRKFYYHQNPEKCIKYYEPNIQYSASEAPRWIYRGENPSCKVKLECLKPGCFTDTFRVYVDRVPRQLLILLVLSLFPGKNIRHKLGYGKAYGYGSIEFEIQGARLRTENDSQKIPLMLQDSLSDIKRWQELAWDEKGMKEEGFDFTVINSGALEKLAQILGWKNSSQLTFTYPPFDKGYFARGISKKDFNDAVMPDFKLENPIEISSPVDARNIAFKLFEIKKPIHFQVYQENSKGWSIIKERKP